MSINNISNLPAQIPSTNTVGKEIANKDIEKAQSVEVKDSFSSNSSQDATMPAIGKEIKNGFLFSNNKSDKTNSATKTESAGMSEETKSKIQAGIIFTLLGAATLTSLTGIGIIALTGITSAIGSSVALAGGLSLGALTLPIMSICDL